VDEKVNICNEWLRSAFRIVIYVTFGTAVVTLVQVYYASDIFVFTLNIQWNYSQQRMRKVKFLYVLVWTSV